MRDEERIQMYYQFGLLDWKSELELERNKPYSKGMRIIFKKLFSIFLLKLSEIFEELLLP